MTAESRFAHLTVEKNEDGSLVVKDEVEGFRSGQTVKVLDDADEGGPFAGTYAGDEGELQIEVVGAPEYDNERLSWGIKTEFHDGFVDVDPSNIEVVE